MVSCGLETTIKTWTNIYLLDGQFTVWQLCLGSVQFLLSFHFDGF